MAGSRRGGGGRGAAPSPGPRPSPGLRLAPPRRPAEGRPRRGGGRGGGGGSGLPTGTVVSPGRLGGRPPVEGGGASRRNIAPERDCADSGDPPTPGPVRDRRRRRAGLPLVSVRRFPASGRGGRRGARGPAAGGGAGRASYGRQATRGAGPGRGEADPSRPRSSIASPGLRAAGLLPGPAAHPPSERCWGG